MHLRYSHSHSHSHSHPARNVGSPSSSPSQHRPKSAPSRSIFSKLLGGSTLPANSPRSNGTSPDEEAEQQRVRDRNMEMAKALERTLRGRSMAGLSSGMDVRCTTLDKTGQVTTAAAHLSKSALCSKYGIQPRDLRKLDSAVPTVVPTILSRKSCILLTMLHLRVVITAQEMTIFDSVGSEDSWLKGVFIWSAEHALKSQGNSPSTGPLPYEFKALEAALTSVVAALENDLANIRSHVVELLNVMETHIDRDNLRLMLQYSRKLSIFQKRAALVQEALDELLSNDDDLAAMYLTAKIQGQPRSADDHEEIELLLESFSKQCEEIVSEVETLSANVRHTEDIIELILDANRNSLLGLDLRVSIATLGLTAGAMIAALFGMNLTSHLEETPYSFTAVTLLAFLLAGSVTGFGLRRLRTLRKVNLGWREELRAAGDRWAARKRSRRRD
ncbi:CorA family magnesium transporter [Sporobolomyces koalae]|uniref:CorA family magnesium transporter n=1 Tax=Sporobolomyces koalae TaxID=500713 RepID=UPI003172295B